MGWEAMRTRLQDGPPISAGPMVDTFRREMARLRSNPVAFAEMVAPQFRLYPHQRLVIDAVKSGRPLIIGMDLGR